MLILNFMDGIWNKEVHAAIRLQYPTSLRDAVARALQVKTVRHEHLPQKIQEITAQEENNKRVFHPCFYRCGELGQIRVELSTAWTKKSYKRFR
ncbi:hypothetical protein EVAR_34285_1 [Eumeta japonica]|uniref:Uncharacterized protein n=1 Tax=Eumeta variegata TaxID=151549 RepID=A0A4C1VYP7_EUMVA|nr:hypothetical protein EVAR_34285_1 [Eumeta japonica]